MDNWTALGTVCCASSRSTSPEKHRIHRLSKNLSVTSSPYGSKYSSLNGLTVEDSRRGIQTVLPGPIKADCEPRFVFLSKLIEAAGMEKSEILVEVLTGKEGNIGNDGDKEKVFPSKPLHPSPHHSHGVYAELTTPLHKKLVCSAVLNLNSTL